MLLEREAVLHDLRLLIAGAGAGSGGLAVIVGPAGAGKTRLVQEARAMAQEAGLRTLSARGGELEHEIPYGVVRQLFEPPLHAADGLELAELLDGAASLAEVALSGDSQRLSGGSEPPVATPGGVEHGLYWLAANVSAKAPLLMAVDDLHWADLPSLRWLIYLVRRLADLPIVLLVAHRPAEDGASSQLRLRLASDRLAQVVGLAPLGEDSVAAMLRDSLGTEAEPGFCRACLTVTGGNPLLLTALISELASEGIAANGGGIRRLETVGAATVAGSLLVRLGRLPAATGALASAVAVLGSSAELRAAARVAGMEPDAASAAADSLVAADIFAPGRPLEFLHPLLRSAVYGELPVGERRRAHALAARILEQGHAAPEHVAPHLLAADPAGDPWVVELLRRAARSALGRGAPEAPGEWLRRALIEPPAQADRAAVLSELGAAEALSHDPRATAHLRECLELTTDKCDYARCALHLGRILISDERGPEAIAMLDGAIERLGDTDRELTLRLEAEVVAAAHNNVSSFESVTARLKRLGQGLAGDTPAERLLLAGLTIDALPAGQPAHLVEEIAERALGDGRLLAEVTAEAQPFYMAVSNLIAGDRLDRAEHHLGAAIDDARRRGSQRGFALASALRATARSLAGRLAEAEADARSALDVAGVHEFQLGPVALSALIDVLVEQARFAEADAALGDARLPDSLPDEILLHRLFASRAKLRIAQGETRRGLEDLLRLGRVWRRLDPPGTNVSWAPAAALAHAELGEPESAVRLASEAVESATAFGAHRPTGMALHASGMVTGGEPGAAVLVRAVRTLEHSPSRLEHARALTDLGRTQLRLGKRDQARNTLSRGLELADRCAATTLAQRCRQELRFAGARPRRSALSGVDALTASEHRVAAMAAQGQTNRQIAQALFVTEKTIENHLTRAYEKLGIHSRHELAHAIDR